MDGAQLARLRGEVVRGVDQHFNFRPATNGARLHVEVVFVDNPANAHLTAMAHPGDGPANVYNWFVEGSATTHAHEIGHAAFGLKDEYVDPSGLAQGRKAPGDFNVHTDDSLMGDYWVRDGNGRPVLDANGKLMTNPQTTLKQRHTDEIERQLPPPTKP